MCRYVDFVSAHTELLLKLGSYSVRLLDSKDFHPCWSVSHLSFVTLTFLRYIGEYFTFGLMDRVRYNEDFVVSRFVISRLLHTNYCNFRRAEEYRSLYRGLGYKDIR